MSILADPNLGPVNVVKMILSKYSSLSFDFILFNDTLESVNLLLQLLSAFYQWHENHWNDIFTDLHAFLDFEDFL